jgi:hypothetical protein
LITVPLNRSHIRGAVELHRASRPWCYRGKKASYVLRAFYDAYANRDFTVGTAGLESKKVVGVVCGATDLGAPAAWLKSRRPWRSLAARAAGGANMALGGWSPDALAGVKNEGRPIYLLAAVTGDDLGDDAVGTLFDTFAAAASSRGASSIFAPAPAPDERLLKVGFEAVEGVTSGESAQLLYVRKL